MNEKPAKQIVLYFNKDGFCGANIHGYEKIEKELIPDILEAALDIMNQEGGKYCPNDFKCMIKSRLETCIKLGREI